MVRNVYRGQEGESGKSRERQTDRQTCTVRENRKEVKRESSIWAVSSREASVKEEES